MTIRNPMDWLAIYHRATKTGADDLAFAKRVLADLTHYRDGGRYSDDDARSLANAMFAYLKANAAEKSVIAEQETKPDA